MNRVPEQDIFQTASTINAFSLVMGFAPLLLSHASCEMLVEAGVFSPCSGGGSELLEVVDVEWPQLVAQ